MRSTLFALLACAAGTLAAAEQAYLTSAANVRLRSAASTEAEVIEMLSLGTRVAASGPAQADGWLPVRVQRNEGAQGWISSSLVVPVTAESYDAVVQELIATRLAREGDGFATRRELLDLVESTLEGELPAQERAQLALQRLKALRGVLQSLPWRDQWDEQMRAWLQQREAQIRYNEPGGQWLVRQEHILATHDANRNTGAADDIAWFAVQNGLGGECEGYVVCYLERLDRLQGEYLRRQPAGSHVEAATGRLIDAVTNMASGSTLPNGGSQYFLDADRECPELAKWSSRLESAAMGSRSPQRQTLVDRLRELSQPCT